MPRITEKTIISQATQSFVDKVIESVPDLERAIKDYLKKDITELFNLIMYASIKLLASDIHFEPQEKNTRLRIRLDGMLHDVTILENGTYRLLLSRIKLLAGLKLNIHDRAQDGSFSVVLPDKEVEIRTSDLPADYGETIVMRILNPESLKNIEELGLRADLLTLFKEQIQKPNGMIIVTGPTGSGKTTSLYAFLRYLQKPEIKIITIEDPIEYRLKGLSQTEVHAEKGYDFANGLRSIVRQDPDVILVGEIRDRDTAKIAIQAALTGHLVFSTLHTNDAAGAIPRLISLGAEPVNIGPAINMVVAQRLVRKVCPKCTQMEKISESDYKDIKKELSKIAPSVKMPKISPEMKIAKPKGCKYCNFTGYKGRIGIFEAFLVDEEMEELILKKPATSQIRNLAEKKGMATMYEDGLIKVAQGITTIEEVKRVAVEK